MNASQNIQRKDARAQRLNAEQAIVACGLSLAPGFSPVLADAMNQSRFNGLVDARRTRRVAKTVEAVFDLQHRHSRLKPGANENLGVSAFALEI